MRLFTILAASAFAMTLAAPAIAQDAMANGAMNSAPAMKMTPAQMKKMEKCHAMTHDAMMKNAGCVKLMKMHPDAMSSDSMMSAH